MFSPNYLTRVVKPHQALDQDGIFEEEEDVITCGNNNDFYATELDKLNELRRSR